MARASDAHDSATVHRPHRAGLPNLREYFGELFRRLDFAKELSDTNMRAANTRTVLGQLWLVVNPLLLAGVYWVLIVVLSGSRGADFAQITGGLFLFFLVSGAIQSCAVSVTQAGSLILNMNFPKQLLIVSAVYMAVMRFLPTMVVYASIHVLSHKPITWHLLWMVVCVFLAALVAVGLGSLIATWQVYFRDTAQFLPYFIRIWLYLSPVLYSAEMFHNSSIGHRLGHWVNINPVFSLLGIWSEAIHGRAPTMNQVIVASVWAFGLAVVGVLYFISRERDFAVRL